MDLDSAFKLHGGWIEEFCAAIINRDTLDIAVYEKDNQCELGKWLYGEGKSKYGRLDSYSMLISSHAEFHKVAGKVAQAINGKDFKLAEELLGEDSEFAATSHKVHYAIQKLKESNHSSSPA